MVLGVCRRRLRDEHAADDAFQATFLILVRKASPGLSRPGESLGPWLCAVAWRVAERSRAHAARRLAKEEGREALAQAIDRTDPQTEDHDVRALIDEEVGRLPEKYRLPVVLCHLEGLTHAEAALRLGCPPSTIGVRLMRARERLRGRLIRRGLAPLAVASAEAVMAELAARAAVPPILIDATIRTATEAGAAPAPVATLARGVIRAMLQSQIRKAALALSSLGVAAALLAALAAAVAKEDPKPGKTIAGTVVDDQDRPVPGAEVWLPVGLKRPQREMTHAVTDAKGRFALPIRDEWQGIDQYDRSAVIWAHAPGHSLGVAPASRAIWGNETSEIAVRLGRATDTTFNVLGPDGRPVAGARVEPYHVKTPVAYEFPPEGMLPSIRATTDARGVASDARSGRQGLFRVVVETKAFGRQTLRLSDTAHEPAERTVRLRPVGRVEGRFTSARPELARGLDVYLSTVKPGPDLTRSQTEGEAHAVADDQGRFNFAALADGPLSLRTMVAKDSAGAPSITRWPRHPARRSHAG